MIISKHRPRHAQATTQQHNDKTYTHKLAIVHVWYYYITQLLFLTTHYKDTNDCTGELPLYAVPEYIKQKKHPSHDNYLYRHWNNPTTRKTPSTAVKYALIGVYDKLLNPPVFFCLFSTFNGIICAVLSYFDICTHQD